MVPDALPAQVGVDGKGWLMNVKEVDLWGWRGVGLTAEPLSLAIAPEAGGRIISLKLDGIEAFFTLPELRGRQFDVANADDVRARKRELGWLHYGGYKTWLAPQDRWTDGLPFLDLDSGSYDLTVEEGPNGITIRVTSPVCRETGMQLSRTVSSFEGERVVVEQRITNRSGKEATWGLWDVTQVEGPGLAVLPVAQESRFPGGVKAYANEGRSPEVMSHLVRRGDGLVAVTCREVEPVKYGTDSMEGWILGLLDRGTDRWLALLKVFEPLPGETYPHDVTAEVYDSGAHPYFELEVHGPLKTLAPGRTYGYSETWFVGWLPKISDMRQVRGWVREKIGDEGGMRPS